MSDATPSFLIFKFGFAESRLRICTVDTIVIFFNNFFLLCRRPFCNYLFILTLDQDCTKNMLPLLSTFIFMSNL